MKINGSLLFDASSASEIQNLRVQKYTGSLVPVHNSGSDQGRLIFVTADGGPYLANTLYFGGAAAWLPIASGGDAAALQTEVDAIETSLGAGVNSNGTFNPGAFPIQAALNNPTSFTNAINQIAAYATSNDTLAELDDVSLTLPLSAGQVLQYNGSAWTDHTLVLADVSDVNASAAEVNSALVGITATAAELNILEGVTGTTAADISSIAGFALEGVDATEFGYLVGVTAPIQTQLNGRQAGDAGLTSLAALTGPGFVTVDATGDVFSHRTFTMPAAGIQMTFTDGTGNPVVTLADDLAALEAMAGTGYVVRTAANTYAQRTINSVDSGRIVITNGNGILSNTDIDLATVVDSGTGTFLKVTVDTYGRVTGTQSVVAGDITALVDTAYVNVEGDTMTGTLTMSGAGTHIVLPNSPTLDTHATNKAYVDAAVAGLSWKQAVKAATTGNITLAGAQTVDGVPLVSGDRVLVKNQTNPAENGIYVVADPGAWTRAVNMDQAGEFIGATVFVEAGTINDNSGWTQTESVTTVDTDPVLWVQFSGSNTYTWGIGLAASGNTINVNLGAGIAQLPSDQVGIELFDDLTGALVLTDDGTARATTSSSRLHLLLASSGGLTQDATGLYIPAAGVTNAMLVNNSITFNGDTGNSSIALGGTLIISGVGAQGVSTTSSAGTVSITVADATTASKGVASFAAADFTVTAGVVSINSIGNGQIDTPYIAFVGSDASSDNINLGESVTFAAATSHAGGTLTITGVTAGNVVNTTIREATTGALGVASFDGNHFSVTAGAVSLAATLDDLTNVSSADAATTNSLLQKSAGDWVAVAPSVVAATFALDDISDVTATHTDGHALVSNGTNWVNQKIYHLHNQGTAATTWSVTHDLGVQYCNVTIVDASNEVVIPQSITFNSTTGLTVTFNTAIAGKVVVMGVA